MSTKQIEDPQTGELISLIPVTHWYDGSLMQDSFCDGIIYFKGETTDPDAYYKRYIEDHMNVKWFGAKGDGVNDDTPNIQHAFDYMHDLRNYLDVANPSYDLCCFIPDGRYLIQSTLLFPTRCTLKGESTNGTILYTDRNDISILFPSEKGDSLNDHNCNPLYSNLGEKYTIISNLTLAGIHYEENPNDEKATNNFNNGILIYKTTKITLQNIYIEGFENAGIHINNSFYVNIDNSVFINNKNGILADSTSTTIEMVNCMLRFNSVGIQLVDSYGCSIINTVIESNIAKYLPRLDINRSPYVSSEIGIIINNCQNISLNNSYFENHTVSVILDKSESNIFTNCYFSPSNNNIDTYVVWFYGSNSSYNKFIDNYYLSSNATIYPAYKFIIFQKDNCKGNVFDLTTKEQLDFFISQNSSEFNDFITNNLKANAPKFFCSGSNEQFIDAERRYIIDKTFGTTSERPTDNLYKGQQYFDSTLGIPIYWQGVNWVKSDGTNA